MPPLGVIFFMCKPFVCEKLSDIGHIFFIEIANCTYILELSMDEHMEAAIVVANE
jgi:hypothetical protein